MGKSAEQKEIEERTKLLKLEIKARKAEQNSDRMGKVGSILKNLVPRGIVHPDSLITNKSLYFPSGKRRGRRDGK